MWNGFESFFFRMEIFLMHPYFGKNREKYEKEKRLVSVWLTFHRFIFLGIHVNPIRDFHKGHP